MQKSSEQYSPEETERRRDEAIRRALNTPPKPQKEMARQSRASKKETNGATTKGD
jgi:hypothetical protein